MRTGRSGLLTVTAAWPTPKPTGECRRGDSTVRSHHRCPAQFREDGPWRVMVAAYRRFMDDLMSRKWNDATRTLRRLDPNHLISFRQGNLPPIDFTLTATPKHVDFFAMEGYDFTPDMTAAANAAGFINRYIHFVTKGKPYLWSEFGNSVWDRLGMRPGENEMASQAQRHELIYRQALETGANGASPWWLAGGYRVSEKSDYGILNPDGTLRPSGRLLQQYAALLQKPRTYPEADTWFTMDRDTHSGGHWHTAYNEGAEAFKAARPLKATSWAFARRAQGRLRRTRRWWP